MKTSKFELAVVMQRGWLLYRATLRICFSAAFLYALLSQLLNIYARQLIDVKSHTVMVTNPIMLGVVLLLTLVILTYFSAIIMLKQNACLLRHKITPQVLLHIFKLLPMMVLASVIFYVLAVVGLYFYIVPGIILATIFYFYLPAILFARQSLFRAFYYSFYLMKQNFLSMLALVLFNFLVFCLPVLLIQASFGRSASGALFGLEELLIVMLEALLLPFVLAMTLTAFCHLRALRQ